MSVLRVLILDTSAFIQGFDSSNPDLKLFTTPMVLDEISNDIAKTRALNWSHTRKLMIMKPNKASIEYIQDKADNLGESSSLSETDRSVLALTYQLKQSGDDVILLSDDYSVQNIADDLGLDYTGLSTRGIRRRFNWIQYCPGCRKEFKQSKKENVCPVCGTKLKRKPVKKSRLRSKK